MAGIRSDIDWQLLDWQQMVWKTVWYSEGKLVDVVLHRKCGMPGVGSSNMNLTKLRDKSSFTCSFLGGTMVVTWCLPHGHTNWVSLGCRPLHPKQKPAVNNYMFIEKWYEFPAMGNKKSFGVWWRNNTTKTGQNALTRGLVLSCFLSPKLALQLQLRDPETRSI